MTYPVNKTVELHYVVYFVGHVSSGMSISELDEV